MATLRAKFIFSLILLSFFLVVSRLFFWQVISGSRLAAEAEKQYFEILPVSASRGKILTFDGFPLVGNEKSYLVYSEIKNIKDENFSQKLAKILEVSQASVSAKISPELFWVALAHKVSQEKIDQIKNQDIAGVGWEREDRRFYPEGSSSAHLLGFVASDFVGQDKGYFGLEGFYDRELKGRPGQLRQEKDVRGAPILIGGVSEEKAKDGRDLTLYLDRTIQFMVEEKLASGLKKYGAKQGSVVIMDPESGGILAMVSLPAYDPANFQKFSEADFKNPVVVDLYEPGSTFKVITMAAAIDSKSIKANDTFQDNGPLTIGEYTIKTWNDKYHNLETMTQILEHSCNIGMAYIGQRLGSEKMYQYLERFGLGEKTGIDLEEEEKSTLRAKNDWKQIDLATASFGQGIALTPIQLLQMVTVLANGGKLIEPHMVSQITDPDGKIIKIKPKTIRQVIKPETAEVLKEMMVSAIENGEAKWTKLKGFKVAGKTGTAQIPVAGHYEEKRTIASFVGFAPADKPRFVMLVRLTEPSSSPWGSETAAPLFFDIAKEILAYYGIYPSE
jgi:cell division protein FtsI/penicillin-binding protein 2